MTFNEFWPTFVNTKRYQVKEATLAAYSQMWENRLQRMVGDIDIEKAKNSDVQRVLTSCLDEGLSIKTAKDVVTFLKCISNVYYVLNDLPPRSFKVLYPTANVETRKAPETFTATELEKLFKYIKSRPTPANMCLLLMATTGIRIGEACGVRYGDFDFKQKTVHISRTVERIYLTGAVSSNGKKETKLIVGSPKTRTSARDVPVHDGVLKIFQNFSKVYPPEAYIATNCVDVVLEPRFFRSQIMLIMKKLGIPYRKPHAFRHTVATMLIQSGTDVRTVAEILGHSDVGTTLNTYTHSDVTAKRKALSSLFRKKDMFLLEEKS